MGDSLPRFPIHRRAKFDAASFILGGEIRNRTNTQNYKQTNTSVFGWTAVYPHMPRASIADRRQSPPQTASAPLRGLACGVYRQYLPPRADLSDFGLLGKQSSSKMGDSMSRTPMNHRAKFDAACAALSPAEKSVTVQTDKNYKQTNKQTNSNRYMHTLPLFGNDNQRSKLNENSVRPTSITYINTNRPVAKGSLKTAPQTPVDHFALIGPLKCTKFVFGRGSAPDPAGGAYDAPADLLVGWEGGYHSPYPTPSTPLASRSRRLSVYPRLCFFSNSTPMPVPVKIT